MNLEPDGTCVVESTGSIRWKQSAQAQHHRIAVVAYYISQARNFAPGYDIEDWLLAQAQVNSEDAAIFESD